MSQDQLASLNAALVGRYALERELAQGGMATVYLADDLRHQRKVAIKVLRPEVGFAVGADRFAREIAIVAQLNHPHILPLYDSGQAGDGLFYVMPYIKGASLRDRLERGGEISVAEVASIARQVASALDYAHSQRLVHRDIKPENILLHEGEAMVADFGIALVSSGAIGDRLTSLGVAVGTPHYMSPEQAVGDPDLDARSDVYSFACVVYELLVGQPPFTGPTPHAVIAQRFTTPPPSARIRRPIVPAAMDRALLKALQRQPENRFGSCREFVDAFASAAEDRPRMPSVAVLPFRNLSPAAEPDFFADGVTEDVIAQLSKIRSLKVISRSSVMRFKNGDHELAEIGRALEVATVLEGSVRRWGDQVRIVAQLIDVESGRTLRSETYDRRLTDIFAIQTDVALQIASALEAELSTAERTRINRKPTSNLAAYQAYLQGRYCVTRYSDDGLAKGIEYFRQAIVADPTFAMAHVGLAQAYAELAVGQGGPVKPEIAYENAMESVTRALEIDNDLGEAHSVLALLKFTHAYDWEGAEREFKTALALSPGGADVYDYYGWMCGAIERYDEALALVRRAQELDPLTHRSDVASTLLRMGLYEEALETARQSVEFDPEYGRARTAYGWALLKLGRVDDGLAELEHAVRGSSGHTLFLGQLGEAYAMYGRPEAARAVLEQMQQMSKQRYVSPYHLAYVYTGLGEEERAMDLLEQSYEERAGSVYGIKGSFLFTTLRTHPRFKALLAKMNLPA